MILRARIARAMVRVLAIAVLGAGATAADAPQRLAAVYPDKTWETRAPDEVGLSRAKLDAFRDFVDGRGCVVRHGYLVYAWGKASHGQHTRHRKAHP